MICIFFLQLATLLKYHDPHFLRGQGEFEDQDDPDWLKNLAYLVQNFNVNMVQIVIKGLCIFNYSDEYKIWRLLSLYYLYFNY